MSIVRLENVVKMYDDGRRAINDMSFALNEYERVCICGASGSSKTTLLKLIAGIEKPSAGSVIVDNEEVHLMDGDRAADFRNRTFGFFSHYAGFLPFLTIIENITMPLAIRKTPERERNNSALEHMETLGISHLAHAYPPQLSVLELRFANLIRALIGRPKILLIDEMDSGLMQKEREKLSDFLRTVWKLGEYTIIFFTDQENQDLPYDRRLMLEYGKITEAWK